MTTQNDETNWIASTQLIVVRSDGERIDVTVRLGTPYRADTGEWRCPLELAGLQRAHYAGGKDALQSLGLAMWRVRYALEDIIDKGGKVLDSDSASFDINATFGRSQTIRDDHAEAEIIAGIEQRIAQAWVDRDRRALDVLLVSEWSVTDVSGQILTKDDVFREAFESTDRRIDSMVIDDVRVKVFGDTAVATGRTRASGAYRGQATSVVLRFTDVFVRRGGEWQAVASHGSLLNS